jgi:hypothetical protein
MSLSNLYFKGRFERPSQEQIDAIAEIPDGNVDGLRLDGESGKFELDIVDKSYTREDLNTCGKSIQSLFDQYQIYSPQRGLYKTWGDIDFNWEISSFTPNLFFELTDDKWAISTYRKIIAYSVGSKVLFIEDDGYELGLYEANRDIISISGPFDYSKWNKICSVKTTIPVGLPTPEELRERYAEYALDYFFDEWEEVDSTWSEGTYELALQNCQSQGGTLEDFEKCMRDSSSDVWKDARVRKEFFYKRGDIVRVEAECGDVVCIWTAIADIPATEEIYNEYVDFKPGVYWQRNYCVSTKTNKCLEYQRRKEPTLGYDVVQIGSLGHYVEMPVPYRLKPAIASLDKLAQIRPDSTTLTQEQIDNLNQPQEE